MAETDGASNFTREKWDEMIQLLDKDGDGTVDKEEYFLAYKKMFPDLTDEQMEAQWSKIDADGDGTLTVLELAQYYGFNLDSETTAEMSDEQILEALQVCVRIARPIARPVSIAVARSTLVCEHVCGVD